MEVKEKGWKRGKRSGREVMGEKCWKRRRRVEREGKGLKEKEKG